MKNIRFAVLLALAAFMFSVDAKGAETPAKDISYAHMSQLGLSSDPYGDLAETVYSPKDILYITYHDWDLEIGDARTQVRAQLIQALGRRRIVRQVPLSVPAPPSEPLDRGRPRDIYTGETSLDVFLPGDVTVIVQAVSPGGVRYLRQSVIRIAEEKKTDPPQPRKISYYASTIGFSNDPLGDWDVTEFYTDEFLYIFVMDTGLIRENPKTRVTARLVQKKRRPGERNVVRTVVLQSPDVRARPIDIEGPVLYKGFIPMAAFRPGYAQLFIDATTPGSAGLARQSVIRIMDLID